MQDLRRHSDHLEEEAQRKDESLQRAQQTVRSILDHASSESRKNSQALRRLTKQLTNSHLISRSAKNLVKLARDFQHVTRLGASASSSQSSSLPSRWLAVTQGWQQPKPLVIGLARIDLASQAEQLMTQSCHWNFPFEWRFSVAQASVAQSAASIANQLEIVAHLSTETSAPAPDQDTRLKSLSGRSYLAFPRLVNDSGVTSDGGWPLPDAELLRLAYVALLCDSSLSVVYVGARDAMQAAHSRSSVHPVLVLARPSACSAPPSISSFWSPYLGVDQLTDELARTRRAMESRQQRVLVL